MAWSQIASLKGDPGDPGPPPNIRVQGGVIQWRTGDSGSWDDLIELSELEGQDGQDGQDGADGTGVTILGSYDSVEDLEAAHPSGDPGDAYLVAGDLYVWSEDTNEWVNVGNIQGPPGADGTDGTDGVPVEFSTGDGWLRWRLVGSGPGNWDNLVTLEDLRGPAGADGADGSDGQDGEDGQRGTGWHTGEGPPGDLPGQIDGDLYLETDTGTVWLLGD